MKKIIPISIICCILISIWGFSNHPKEGKKIRANSIFQYSTLNALLEGIYDGELTVGELKKQGNFGLGTFNALDGELILLDGKCYKATSDFKIQLMSDSVKVPFAAICNFSSDTTIKITHPIRIKDLENKLDSLIGKPNLIYGCKLSGKFDSIIIRSVPKQEKPYKRLIEAYKKQGVITYMDQQGVLLGYKFPKYLKDVNLDDYHFHFLSSDKSKGGHLLNCTLLSGEVSVAFIRNYSLQLPDNDFFNHATFTNKKSELMLIEGSKQ